MKAIILGSGNVAEALAVAMAARGGTLELVQLYARSEAGRELAARLGVPFTDSPAALADADIYIMAVSDSAIGELSAQMNIPATAVVAHTAGGVSIDALSPHIAHRAVLYPLQTFTKGCEVNFAEVPLFIEYNDTVAGCAVRRLADMLSKSVAEADSALRVKLHTAAVFACNFTNHLYSLGNELLREKGLEFNILAPLITETARKAIASGTPASVQTGPAARDDRNTMQRHVELLAAEGKTNQETIYKLLSKSIWETSKKI
jgi:predicted short-subunit dehydrogenase-like oxidoreductase (DUF2520 family)